ncbi:cysteine--tRNA ligase [Candidatus Gracilibacteria bacterium]|nr:cysteine--tRNA ligase [Candidatus Gracilibacteria bacterium]
MQIYNTLTRKKEVFKPLRHPEVKLYYCGPTVYNNAHIGNLKTSVIEDAVTRSLSFLGYQVKTTMNITDIEDKIIRDSYKAGESLEDFTKKYTDVFLNDLEKLRVIPADNIKKVTELIPEMIRMIQTLLNRGYAYLAEGSIYYSVKKFKKYGQLVNLDMKGMKESVRIDNDEYDKDVAADFVLWKAWKDEDGENFWEEEFTINNEKVIVKGRPGWHIECSACAMKYFGTQIDIHMGGEDLIFPHHQNEIAQTEACTGKEFSKYWIHSGHVMVDGKKMSKSLGNFYTLRDLEEKYSQEKNLYRAVRLGFMNGKYRDQIDFSFGKLEQNIKTIGNIDSACKKLVRYMPEYSGVRPDFRESMQDFMSRYIEALEDDFSFPEAFGVFFEFQKFVSSEINRGNLTSDEQQSCVDMYLSFNEVLDILDISVFEGEENQEIPEGILEKANARDAAKADKNYELSDQIRDEIIAAGYTVSDTADGTVVEKQ